MVCVQFGHLVVTLPALTECAADLVTSGFAEPEAVFAIDFFINVELGKVI